MSLILWLRNDSWFNEKYGEGKFHETIDFHHIKENIQFGGDHKIIKFLGSEIHVGRSVENEIILNDEGVSREHCVFIKKGLPDQWIIRDRHSTNGTIVNQMKITTDHELKPGDQILLGATLLEVK